MAKKSNESKTYILGLKDGNVRKVTIPSHWKMTFGSLLPFSSEQRRGADGGVALRFYEGNKENLRAVMTDVVSIRDASISMIEKRTSVQRKTAQKETPKGMKDLRYVGNVAMTTFDGPPASVLKQLGLA